MLTIFALLLSTAAPAARPPAAAEFALRLGGAWATAVGPIRAVTITHVVDSNRHALVLFDHLGTAYPAAVLCSDKSNKDTDAEDGDGLTTLVLQGDAKFSWWVDVADDRPKVQDQLWWRGFLSKAIPTTSRGWYLGKNDEGYVVADGWVFFGSSGSPVLNDRGQLVAVVMASYNDAAQARTKDPETLDVRAFRAAHFRSLMAAISVKDGPCALK